MSTPSTAVGGRRGEDSHEKIFCCRATLLTKLHVVFFKCILTSSDRFHWCWWICQCKQRWWRRWRRATQQWRICWQTSLQRTQCSLKIDSWARVKSYLMETERERWHEWQKINIRWSVSRDWRVGSGSESQMTEQEWTSWIHDIM